MKRLLSPDQINALAADPARCTRVDLALEIDPTRPFMPESYTQLYYTPLYGSLSDAQRLRYNQLFALRNNEYIMMLEADLIERLLPPLLRHPQVRDDAALTQAVQTMRREEQRHFAGFAALNRHCRPDLYPAGRDRHFSLLPRWTQAMFDLVGWLAARHAFALWYLMAMEESAKSLARDMLAHPETETLGRLDPGFVSVHREHLKDETRHLHIDTILIRRCLGGRALALDAWLFRQMLTGVVRPTRGGSGVRVIRQLVRDLPELACREEELISAVLALKDDRRFLASLFNRRIMPETFRIFDQTPALADLGRKMVGYDRREAT